MLPAQAERALVAVRLWRPGISSLETRPLLYVPLSAAETCAKYRYLHRMRLQIKQVMDGGV